MYHERYDPSLHPDETPPAGFTLDRFAVIAAVVSGSLCLYALVTVIT